ncbi:OmpA family protein [Streptomyces beihaiensis]|uniref:OmpA family protein n=1 Tax=Streptomyces beihaiensis TaxID=2984495 RepID=A0ABT3TSR5_9ACTN|nr:OmpA family protein [Streptomyces beihaiensis]MCX3060084.1 OmpA family protein [Streptomyces beihaiensis]
MPTASPRTRRTTAALAAATVTVVLAAGAVAHAAPRNGGPGGAPAPARTGAPPGSTTTSPPPHVDASSPGLRLADGATLAPAKVLDIKSVVEDMSGDERRSDTSEDVTFALQAEVLFAKDSARLNPDAKARIGEIADEVERQKAQTVRVFGFTDNLGTYAHGLKLSKARAEAVHDALATALGAQGSDITFQVRGYSEDYPIADNSTEEGRRKNRRVEVSFPKSSRGGS